MKIQITRVIYTSYKLLQIEGKPPFAAWGPKTQKPPPDVAELNHLLVAFGMNWYLGRPKFPDDVSPA